MMDDITIDDILAFKEFLKTVPGSYNKCFTLLNQAFDFSELWGYRPKNSNPCSGVQKYAGRKMERFLKNEELKSLEEVLATQENNSKKISLCFGDDSYVAV